MARTVVYFYKESDEKGAPVRAWLEDLRRTDRRAFAKCAARIRRLEHEGHALRRPEADILRDGIYELRVRSGRVNYRVLYFFHGRNVALLAHGLTKERGVPHVDIERAPLRKRRYDADPAAHIEELDVG